MTDQIEEKQESKTKEKWKITRFYGGKKVTVLKEDVGYKEAKLYADRIFLDRLVYEKLTAEFTTNNLNQLI
jgi:hypothetical protein